MNKVYLLLSGVLRPGNWGCGRVGFTLNKEPKGEVGKETSRFCFYQKNEKTPSATQEPWDKLVPALSFMRVDISGTVGPQRSFCSSLLTLFSLSFALVLPGTVKRGLFLLGF